MAYSRFQTKPTRRSLRSQKKKIKGSYNAVRVKATNMKFCKKCQMSVALNLSALAQQHASCDAPERLSTPLPPNTQVGPYWLAGAGHVYGLIKTRYMVFY